MNSPIIAIPANMNAHVQEVFAGAYDIQNLEFDAPPTILDLGANLGSFALWAAERWPGSKIYCYEPHPGNFELLQKNVESLGENVLLFPQAVSDHRGSETLYDGKHNCGEASLYQTAAQLGERIREVEVVPGGVLPAAQVLKLDTEGAEWPILATYQHWDAVRAVMFEWHSAEDAERISTMLRDKGFDCVDDRRTVYKDRGLQKWAKGLPKTEGVSSNTVNLLIGMPCYGGMTHATHNRSMMELRDTLHSMQVKHDPRYLPSESLIPRARNYFGSMCLLDKDASGQPYTHLLFLDVDIGFNARDIISLIALDKDIAALPYSAKDLDWKKIVEAIKVKGIEDPETLRRIAGRPIINAHEFTTFRTDQAVQFPQLGTGILLIKRSVFEKFADAEPERRYKLMLNENPSSDRDYAYDFFRIGVNPETNYYDSEDYRFCLDARNLGFDTWLWPNAVTQHVGNYAFWMDIPSQAALGINTVAETKSDEELHPLQSV